MQITLTCQYSGLNRFKPKTNLRTLNFCPQKTKTYLKDIKVDATDITSKVYYIRDGNKDYGVFVRNKSFAKVDKDKKSCCNFEYYVLNAKCKAKVSADYLFVLFFFLASFFLSFCFFVSLFFAITFFVPSFLHFSFLYSFFSFFFFCSFTLTPLRPFVSPFLPFVSFYSGSFLVINRPIGSF